MNRTMKPWLLILIIPGLLSGVEPLRGRQECSLDAVIFIVDEWQRNSRTYYYILDFAQGLRDEMSTGEVTLLTLDSRQSQEISFNVIFETLDVYDMTPEVWRGRVKSIWTEKDLEEACVEIYTDTILVAIDLPLPLTYIPVIRNLTKGKEEKLSYEFESPKLKVFEIHTVSQEAGAYTEFFMTYRGWLLQYWFLLYKDLEEFQSSFNALQKEACRSTSVFKTTHALFMLANDTCGPRTCYEHYERDWSTPSVTATMNDYLWSLKVKLHPRYGLRRRKKILWMDWSEAQRICSAQGLSLLTIRSEKEAQLFSRLISLYFEKIMSGHLPDTGEIDVKVGLRRDRESAGQRFSWDTGKDLLFSHWASGEPSEISVRECADWKFIRNNASVSWTDAGWHTSGCGNTSAQVIICEKKVPPTDDATLLTIKHGDNYTTSEVLEKGAFGLLTVNNRNNENVVISMSMTVASGILFELHKHNIEIRSLVQFGFLFSPNTDERDMLDQLHSLVHICDDMEHGHRDGSVLAVPLARVCDGVKDCSKGSDENSCGINGYVPCLPNEFTCSSKQCVPVDARCDLVKDCQDGSDETVCELECPHRQCTSGRCLPSSWFHDGFQDCDDGSDEIGNASVSETCVFICNRTKCVTKEMITDSKVDCHGFEGPLDKNLRALEWINCSQSGNAGFINNYAPRCVLVRDMFSEVIGCRNYEHLSACANFSCPEHFVKCPESFCIPMSYVHDEIEDCDKGEDEGSEFVLNIADSFLCNYMKKKKQLVPLPALCDGKKDCPLGEDELDCGYRCPSGFICLAGAVKAFSYNKTAQPLHDLSFIDPRTRYLDLSGVSIPKFFYICPRDHLKYLLTLKLCNSNINTIALDSPDIMNSANSSSKKCGQKLKNRNFLLVRLADLSYNKLNEIPECSFFRVMQLLQTLNMSHNYQLTQVHRDSFYELGDLEVLDLSFTGISWLGKDVFQSLTRLKTLSLKKTGLTVINFILPGSVIRLNFEESRVSDINLEAFRQVRSLQELLSPTYKLCCPVVLGPRIHSHVCHFSGDAMSSCTDLVKETPLRVTLWIVSLAILAGNIITLLYRLTWERALLHKPYGLFVTNLGVSDLMMGAYLMVIAVADVIFKEVYVLHDYKWRNSHACWIAGVLATLSSITSTIFVALITVDRFIVMKYPYGDVRFSPITMTTSVTAAWVFGLTAASLPLLPFAKKWVIFSNSGMCLGLPLNNERLPGWQYSAVLFVGLNLLLFSFIGVGQFFIYKMLREKGKRTRKNMNPQSQLSQSQRMQEFAVARQLSLIVMTNFICWFPIITMGIMALSGNAVGPEAYRWSAVLILPVNSALNPVLYTLPALKKKWTEFRDRHQKSKVAKGVEVGTSRVEETNRSVRKPDTRKLLLLRSCRSMAAVRRLLTLNTQHSEFAASDLSKLYSRVSAQRTAVVL